MLPLEDLEAKKSLKLARLDKFLLINMSLYETLCKMNPTISASPNKIYYLII